MIDTLRRLALPITIAMLGFNALMLLGSLLLWALALVNGWIDSVEFVSHVSMLALVYGAIGGIAGAVAAVLALFPTDDHFTDGGGR